MTDKIINTTDENFNKDIQASKVVLVDFWAPWCGPCRMLTPRLEELANEIPELTVVKLNIDEHSEVAAKMGVRSIPTLALYSEGVHVGTKVGALSKEDLKSFLKNA